MKEKIKQILQIEKIQAALIIFVSLVVFFYPIFLKGEVIVSDVYLKFSPYDDLREEDFNFDSELRSDMIDSYYPKKKLFFDSIKEGKSPHWENNLKFGVPTTNILDYYFPLEYLSLIIPIQYVLTLITLAKIFISGFCTYLLGRALGLKHISSIFAAIAYIYSGFNVVWFWNNAGTTGFLLPVFILGVVKLLQGRFYYSLLVIYTTAILMLSGFIAGAGYVFYFAALFALVCFLKEVKDKYSAPKSLIKISKTYIILFVSVCLGLSLTLFALVPTTKYLNHLDVYSYRSASNANYYLDPQTSLPQLLNAYYNGGPIIGNFIGGANYNESSGYIGLIGIIFFIIGAFYGLKTRRGWVIFFTLMNLFSISVIYKIGPTLNVISDLPIFDSSSNTRLLMWFCFTGVMVAAYGFDRLDVFWKYFKGNRKGMLNAIGVSLTIAALISAILISKILGFDLEVQKQEVSPEFYRLVVLLVSILALSTLVLTLVFIGFKGWKNNLFHALIVLVAFAELFIYGLKQPATLPPKLFYPETEGIRFLQENTNNLERIMAFDGTFALRGTEAYYDLPITNDHNLYSEPEKVQIKQLYKDENLMWMSRTSPRNEANNVVYDSPKMDEFNVKFLVFAPEQEFSEDSQKALEANFDLVYNHPQDLKIYQNKGGYSLAHSEDPQAQIILESIENTYEKFKVISSKEALFYVSESYYPGWEVKVNGNEADIEEYDGLFRAVRLSEGESVVEFRYEVDSFFKYALIYALSVNLLIAILVIFSIYKRFNHEKE